MLNKKTKKALFVLLGVTLVLKLIAILVVIPLATEQLPYTIGGFVDRYDYIARNLLAGNGYRIYPDTSETLLRSPGYVLVLTALFYLFGESLAAAQVFNMLFDLGAAYFVVMITANWIIPGDTEKAGSDRLNWLALAPAAIFLFHPGVLLSETRGGVESLFMLLFSALVYFLYKSIQTCQMKHYLFAGLLLGLSMLVKSTPALIPVALFPYILWKAWKADKGWVVVVRNYAVMGLTAFIILAPWGVRNYLLTGEYMLTSTVKGTTAFQGMYVNQHFGSGVDRDPLLLEATATQKKMADDMGLKRREDFFNVFYSTQDEVEFDRHMYRYVIDEYRASPWFFVKSCALNFMGFWIQGRSVNATYLNIVLAVPMLTLVIWGVVAGYRKRLNISPLVIVILAFIAPHVPILGVARYHIPLLPFLAILAVVPFVRKGREKAR